MSGRRRGRPGWLLGVLVLTSLPAARAAEPQTRPLPPLNAKVAEFARSHLGRPVGDGICLTLAIEALRAADAQPFPLDDPTGEYVWGEPVADLRTVLPGDILQFRNAEFLGSRYAGKGRRETWHDTYPHHTAIVVRTEENGRLITIAHQNVERQGGDPQEVGNVREALLRMNSLQKGGQIHAYRPVALDPATRQLRSGLGRSMPD